MGKNKNIIGGKCSMFACRICRTKYGWQHQPWCEAIHITAPVCADCCYLAANGECIHPLSKKVGAKA